MSQAVAPEKSTRSLVPGERSVAPATYHASVSGWRFLRAYATTFSVIASYLALSLGSRFLGRGWRESRLASVHTRNARRVYKTILRLQGLFIKVGQLLSIMANFLPEEFRVELEALQDQVPPRPFREIEARIQRELGGKTGRIASLDRTPIASASLGQVHMARLSDGRRIC